MEISFVPICADFHETGHLSLIFEDVFCNGFYPDLMKNLENGGKILCMPVSKILLSLHCTWFHNTHKCSLASLRGLLYQISPRFVKKCLKYGWDDIHMSHACWTFHKEVLCGILWKNDSSFTDTEAKYVTGNSKLRVISEVVCSLLLTVVQFDH